MTRAQQAKLGVIDPKGYATLPEGHPASCVIEDILTIEDRKDGRVLVHRMRISLPAKAQTEAR